jgi:hypothetical protein
MDQLARRCRGRPMHKWQTFSYQRNPPGVLHCCSMLWKASNRRWPAISLRHSLGGWALCSFLPFRRLGNGLAEAPCQKYRRPHCLQRLPSVSCKSNLRSMPPEFADISWYFEDTYLNYFKLTLLKSQWKWKVNFLLEASDILGFKDSYLKLTHLKWQWKWKVNFNNWDAGKWVTSTSMIVSKGDSWESTVQEATDVASYFVCETGPSFQFSGTLITCPVSAPQKDTAPTCKYMRIVIKLPTIPDS